MSKQAKRARTLYTGNTLHSWYCVAHRPTRSGGGGGEAAKFITRTLKHTDRQISRIHKASRVGRFYLIQVLQARKSPEGLQSNRGGLIT